MINPPPPSLYPLFQPCSAMNKYLFGSPEPLTLEVMIKNNYEDAFEAAFYMMTPPDLQFTKLQQLGEKMDMPITCSAPDGNNNFTIKCDIGNPLKGGNMVSNLLTFLAFLDCNC